MGFGTVVALLFLLLVNAFYVAAEFAIVSARRSRVRSRAAAGSTLARKLVPILADRAQIDRYISGCQFMITVAALALGALGEQTLVQVLRPLFESAGGMQETAAHSVSSLLVLAMLTGLQVVLCEQVPKVVALQYPNRTAIYTLVPMQWTLRVLGPLIALLNGSSQGLIKLLRLPSSTNRHVHSPEEIGMLIEESRRGGLLDPGSRERLQQALRLRGRSVRQLMVPRQRIQAVPIDASPEVLQALVVEGRYSRVPVYEESIDHVVGILRSKDLVRHVARGGDLAAIGTLLRSVFFVHEGTSAARLIALMRERHSHVAIVMDDFGGVAGMVTIEDILGELFGEVSDEFSVAERAPERLPDGRLRLPGTLRLVDANELFGVQWESKATTLGGFVIERFGRIPANGAALEVDGVRIEVERAGERAVDSLLVRPGRAEGGPADG